MKIDFNEIECKSMPEFKGGKLHYDARIADDGNVKIMSGRLVPGASIGSHTHTDSCEVIFVTSGVGTVYTPEGTETVAAGDCTYCPKGGTHSLVNEGDADLTFYAVVPQQ